jgi:hypothetical protein
METVLFILGTIMLAGGCWYIGYCDGIDTATKEYRTLDED